MTDQADFSLQQLVDRIEPGATIVEARKLRGGISYDATALDLRGSDGSRRRWVVRRAGVGLLAYNPRQVETEYRLLQLTAACGLPTPPPIALDQSPGAARPDVMVLDYIEGEPAVAIADPIDCARQFAQHLAAIHQITSAENNLEFLTDHRDDLLRWLSAPAANLDDSLGEAELRAVLGEHLPGAPHRNAEVLLHGDFWPGNVLWNNGKVTGVIDWEDARVGDPAVDVAITRLDLKWCYGDSAMDAFTAAYAEASGADLSDLPLWDLGAALRPAGALPEWAAGWPAMGRSDVTLDTLRQRHGEFVARAMTALGL